jgi:hypothetical protein
MVPEMLKVWLCVVAVKFTPVTFVPFTVALRLTGANV